VFGFSPLPLHGFTVFWQVASRLFGAQLLGAFLSLSWLALNCSMLGFSALPLFCSSASTLHGFTFLYEDCQTISTRLPSMSTPLLLELFAGFLAAGIALWFVLLSRSSQPLEVMAEGSSSRLAAGLNRS
jgi:hypothetical protein